MMRHISKNYTLATTRPAFINDISRMKDCNGRYLWTPGLNVGRGDFVGMKVDHRNNDINEIMQKVQAGDLKIVGIIVEKQE